MFTTVLIALLVIVHPVACQIALDSDLHGNNPDLDFQQDHLNPGILGLFCMFTFLCLLLTRWCFMVLISAREHRALCAGILFLSLIMSILANVSRIALGVFSHMSEYNLPAQLHFALDASDWLFTNWAILLMFLSVVAVLLNREDAIYSKTGGQVGRRNHGIPVVYTTLAIILFMLGTAGPAFYFLTVRKYQNTLNQINFEFNATALPEKGATLDLWHEQSRVWEGLGDMFDAFVVLAGVVVVVSTVLLWRKVYIAGIKDKITNTMIHVAAPLCATYSLFALVFLAVNSNQGPLPLSNVMDSATLVWELLSLLFYLAIAYTLLLMSSNEADWSVQGGAWVQPTHVLTK